MSLRSKFQKAKAQGYIRTAELLWTRFVPPWIFRYCKGSVFDLDLEKLIALNEQPGEDVGDGLIAKCLVNAGDSSAQSNDSQRTRLREFTWNSAPLESTSNDFGYAIYDSQDPQKLLGGVWVAADSFIEDNLGLNYVLSKDQAWLYCAFVDGEARGRGIYKKLLSVVAQDVEKRGYSRLLTVINPWNRVSTAVHQKRSKQICGDVSCVRVFWLAWVSRSGNVEIDKRMLTSVTKNPANVTIN